MIGRIKQLSAALSLLPDAPEPERLTGPAAVDANVAAQEAWIETHLSRCGVPAAFASLVAAGLSVDGYPAVVAARGWAAKPGAVFLLMSGGPGSGKSCAAAETCKLARRPFYAYDSDGQVFSSWQYDPRRAFFVTAAALWARAAWTNDGAATWRRAHSVPLLVVDDLGIETLNDQGPFLSDFQDLIVDRHGNERRTVVTTNLDSATFKKRYGPRVLDRVLEKGIACNVGNASKRGMMQK